MQPSRPVLSEDRLPWLEPYREPRAKGGRLPRTGYGRPFVIGLAMALVIAAAAIGYWLGQREAAPPDRQASDVVAVPPARQQPADLVRPPEAMPAMRHPTVEPAPPPKVEAPVAEKPRTAPRKAGSRAKRSVRKIRSAGVESSRLKAIRAAQRRPARRASAWPKMPSPGPAGQVIQLGAFSTSARAHAAYRVRVARYPLLARMPRVVVPIISKPDRRVLYVLRLGTTSRQQSHVVCRNLRASGDHCLVIG